MAIIKDVTQYFPDPTKGRPLFYGQVYVGEPDLDPQIPANQKQLNVIQEGGTVVPVAQPFILSAGGTPVYEGSNVQLDTAANYSIKVLDKNGDQIYYVADSGASDAIYQTLETTLEVISGSFGALFGNEIIETLGYSTPGDGGAAQWKFTGVTGQTPNQSPADLGDALINDASGNQWALVIDDEINPVKLGARFDGTDDSLPMQAAINRAGIISYERSAPNSTRNEFSSGVVRLPRGEITISSTLLVQDPGVSIIGSSNTVIRFTGANSLFKIVNYLGIDSSLQKIQIKDMYLRQVNIDPPSTNSAIDISNTKHWRIENVRFGGFFSDVVLNGAQEPGFITNCNFFSGSAFTASYAGGSHIVVGSAEVSSSVGTLDPDTGLYLLQSVMVFVSDCEFRAGDLSKTNGIAISAVDGFYMDNCHILNSSDAMFKVDVSSSTSPVSNVKVSNCFFDGNESNTNFALLVQPPSYATAQSGGHPVDLEFNNCKFNGVGNGSGTRVVSCKTPYIARLSIKNSFLDKCLGDYFVEITAGGRFLELDSVTFRSEDSFSPSAFILIGSNASLSDFFDYTSIKSCKFYETGVTKATYNIRASNNVGDVIISNNDFSESSGPNGDGLLYSTTTGGNIKGDAATLNNTKYGV